MERREVGDEEFVDDVLSNFDWECSLIRNGLELEQHTEKEADELRRAEYQATKQALLDRLREARLDEIATAHAALSNNKVFGDGNLSFTMYAGRRMTELTAQTEEERQK